MRDGSGNKLSPEEQQKVKSIQGVPDEKSLKETSINPTPKDTGEADRPAPQPGKVPGFKGAE